LKYLDTLVVTDNQITEVSQDAFPPKLRRLGIGRNKITELNGALRYLTHITNKSCLMQIK
jgi:Leucine-rich repeat (LRR) protein